MSSPEKAQCQINQGAVLHMFHHVPQRRYPNSVNNPALPLLRLAGRSSLRYQFWLLCSLVLFLVVMYGTVFWDTMTQTPKFRVKINQWEHPRRTFDLHVENQEFNDGETGEEFLHHENHKSGQKSNTVALGCAMTTHMYKDLTLENIQYRLPFLRTLLPSFCNTASGGYDYHFYVSFDVGDVTLQHTDFLNSIHDHFQKVTSSLCTKEANVTLHFVQCNHNHNPAWAQNDAMMEAYLDDMEYFYRVNDDTLMLSPGWTETYIEVVRGFDPPLIGVVGPVHRGGNEFILTYDFVHRTHINIFGYYYPRIFTDWWADDWITAVYGQERTVKLPGVRLKHTQEAGQRYKVQYNNGELVHYQVAHDRRTLNRYIYSVQHQEAINKPSSNYSKKVISMSLWGNDPKYTYGAIRNAQLVPVFFPGWTLRVYVEETSNGRAPRYNPPPKRIIHKLASLGAQIIYVDTKEVALAPMLWRFLAADDLSLDCFIVRDSDARLNDRDAAIVEDWLLSDSPLHCVRDHPSHSAYALSGGMWGARPRELQKIIPIPWKHLMMGYRDSYGLDMTFLANLIWKKVEPVAYCHDSYSCKKWPGSHPFPVRRRGTEHVGQVFDAFGYARDMDMKIIRETPEVAECTLQNASFAEPGAQSEVISANTFNSAQLKQLEEDIEKRNSHHQIEVALKDSLLVNADGESLPELSPNVSFSTQHNASLEVLGRLTNEQVPEIYHPGFMNDPSLNETRQFVVWNMDYHIGPIRDIKYMLRSHNDMFFIEKSLASKCYLTDSCASKLKVVNKKNGMTLSPELRKAFWEDYQDDPEMNLVTHYLCTYPPAMCEMYVPFHKPIILYITSRYEHARYTRNQWDVWNRVLKEIVSDHHNMVIASNLYDAQYLHYHTGFMPNVIAPRCSYVQASYAPVKLDVLIAPIHNPTFYELFHGYLNSIIRENKESLSVCYIPDMYPEYKFSDIASHPAVVHIPYQVSTYTFCEHYAMNIPIFAPSLHLLATWHKTYDVISHLTWNRIRGLLGDTRAVRVYNTNMSNPNNLHEVNNIKEWLQYADFYQRPHIIYFNSVRDLVRKLTSTDLKLTSENMKKYNKDNELHTEEQWSAVFL